MRYLKACVAVVLINVGIMSIGYANDITGRFGIDGYVGLAMPVGPEWTGDADNVGMEGGLGFRYGISKRWSAALSYDDIRIRNGIQLKPICLSAGYMFAPQHRLTPVASLGIGLSSLGKSYSSSIPCAKAGFGLEYFLNSDWTLSALANYHFVHAQGTTAFNQEVQALTGGLMLTYFFPNSESQEAVSTKTEPVVQQPKEEIKQAVAEVPPAPAPPVPAPIQAPIPTPVQEIKRETKTLELKVLFDSGKTIIKNDYMGEIDRLGDFLAKYPEASVVIEGHTDATGSEKTNQELSQGRADSIRTYLIEKKGIAGARIKAVGFGSSKPIAPNDTSKGRAANRRVMAEFKYQE